MIEKTVEFNSFEPISHQSRIASIVNKLPAHFAQNFGRNESRYGGKPLCLKGRFPLSKFMWSDFLSFKENINLQVLLIAYLSASQYPSQALYNGKIRLLFPLPARLHHQGCNDAPAVEVHAVFQHSLQ